MRKLKLTVRAIFFDLDGTIVDSRKAYKTAMKTALAKMGKQKMIDAKLVTEIPRRLEQNLPIGDLIEGNDASKFLKEYLRAYYESTATNAKPIRSISEVLERLSHKVKLALITMRCVPKEKVIEELEKFGLATYFQSVITAFDTHNPKPSPEALLKCAEQLRVEICKCAVVGDSVADIRAGKNAGAKTVAVLSGIFSRQELEMENPDLVLKSVKELPDFLE
jgi:HAD superfamily hydrolase (TIGR01509 family)